MSLTAEQRETAMLVASGIVRDESRPELAVMLARSLIASGSLSPAVLELAGLSVDPRRVTMADAAPLIRAIFDEFDVELPSLTEASWITARQVAREILAGTTEPLRGAVRLWRLAGDCEGASELWQMLELVDEFDEGRETRERTVVKVMVQASWIIEAADRRLNG